MAINPYGMAYGIGQMLGGVPDAYYQGQQQAIQDEAARTKNQLSNVALEQQNINLAEMQRQEQDRQNLDQELAKQVPEGVVDPKDDPAHQLADIKEWHAKNLENSGYGGLANNMRKESMEIRQKAFASEGKRAAQMIVTGNFKGAADVLKKQGILSEDGTLEPDPSNKENVIVTNRGIPMSVSSFDIEAIAAGEKNIWQVRASVINTQKKVDEKSKEAKDRIDFLTKKLNTDDATKRYIAELMERGRNIREATRSSDRRSFGSFDSRVYEDAKQMFNGDAEAAANFTYGMKEKLAQARMKEDNPDLQAANAVAGLEKGFGFIKDPKKRASMEAAYREQYERAKPGPRASKFVVPTKGATPGAKTPKTEAGKKAHAALFGNQ